MNIGMERMNDVTELYCLLKQSVSNFPGEDERQWIFHPSC